MYTTVYIMVARSRGGVASSSASHQASVAAPLIVTATPCTSCLSLQSRTKSAIKGTEGRDAPCRQGGQLYGVYIRGGGRDGVRVYTVAVSCPGGLVWWVVANLMYVYWVIKNMGERNGGMMGQLVWFR